MVVSALSAWQPLKTSQYPWSVRFQHADSSSARSEIGAKFPQDLESQHAGWSTERYDIASTGARSDDIEMANQTWTTRSNNWRWKSRGWQTWPTRTPEMDDAQQQLPSSPTTSTW